MCTIRFNKFLSNDYDKLKLIFKPGRALVKMVIFLFLIETICCDPSSEPSQRDGSYEGSEHIFLLRINKNYP